MLSIGSIVRLKDGSQDLYYCSLPINAEKFSLIRTRKNLPI